MAVVVRTSMPSRLLHSMIEACRADSACAWHYDDDGDFTYYSEEMTAWMRPKVGSDRITFGMIAPKDQSVSTAAYAEYHADLIRWILLSFDHQFDSVRATAQPMSADSLGNN